MCQQLFVSAVGGVAAAIVFAVLVQLWRVWLGCKQVAAVSALIVRHRGRVLDIKDPSPPADGRDWSPVNSSGSDAFRAHCYNQMIRELRATLDHWSPQLPLHHKQSLLEALDWFHIQSDYAEEVPGTQFIRFLQEDELTPGLLPGERLSQALAEKKFKILEDLKWLDLPKAESSD